MGLFFDFPCKKEGIEIDLFWQAVFCIAFGLALEYRLNSPTIREIQRGCGISSTSMVEYYLDTLICERRIEFTWASGTRKILVRGGEWRLTNGQTNLA